jgi:hypothetical protein
LLLGFKFSGGNNKMKKILPIVLVSSFLCGSVLADEKAFHPTDALLIGGNGGFNPTPDETDVVDLGLDDEPVKAFHPTDALLIGGNGPFNAKPDAEDEVDLGLDGWSWW